MNNNLFSKLIFCKSQKSHSGVDKTCSEEAFIGNVTVENVQSKNFAIITSAENVTTHIQKLIFLADILDTNTETVLTPQLFSK